MRRIILFLTLLLLSTSTALATEPAPTRAKEVTAKEAFELSERCAKFATQKFKEEFGKEGCKRETDGQLYCTSYSNHYNSKQNKCYILIKTHVNGGDDVSDMRVLFDLHENKDIASLHVIKYKIIDCRALNKSCKSEEEWESLTKPYMEE